MYWPSHYKQPAPVDKTGWPEGPWHDEPDYEDFVAHGLECRVMRHPRSGHFCGYVSCEHQIPEELLPEGITGGGATTYGFDCGHINNYKPGERDDLQDPVGYCTFEEIKRRTEGLARALAHESVWWRRALRAVAPFLRLKLRNWPRWYQ